MRTLAAVIALLFASAAQSQVGRIDLIDANGNAIAAFTQCAAIGTHNDVVDVMGGGGTILQVPGNLHVNDIVCTRAASGDVTLWNWRKDLVDGKQTAFKNGSLQAIDTTGSVVLTWLFAHGWLSKIQYDADATGGITETAVLTTDQLSRSGQPLVPSIDWTPQSLTYGDLLGANQLNATTTAPGSFSYDPAAGTLLPAGTQTLSATFTPTDPAQFQSVTVTARVTVNKAPLTVKADDLSRVYGAANPALTYTITGFVNGENASVVSGSPLLSTTATSATDAGQYPITVAAGTLSAANYSFSFAGGTLTITKADQTISWATPTPIVYGTLLGSTQLNATASVVGPASAGALTYTPAAGTLLNAGDQLLTVSAAETNDYRPATASVHLIVLKATPSFSGLSSPIIAKGTAATVLSGHISAGALIPPAGESVAITLNGTAQPAPIQIDGSFSSSFATASLAVSATPYPIQYDYAGDANFNAISGTGGLTVAYVDVLAGTVNTPAPGNQNGNRPFRVKLSGTLTGSVAGDFTAFVNYGGVLAGPGVTSSVTDGTWLLHATGKKPAPNGNLQGTIAGGTIQWSSDGTVASIELQLTIDSGSGDFLHTTGSGVFHNGVWNATPNPTISGQLLLFY